MVIYLTAQNEKIKKKLRQPDIGCSIHSAYIVNEQMTF
jgi:hypothetical protein